MGLASLLCARFIKLIITGSSRQSLLFSLHSRLYLTFLSVQSATYASQHPHLVTVQLTGVVSTNFHSLSLTSQCRRWSGGKGFSVIALPLITSMPKPTKVTQRSPAILIKTFYICVELKGVGGAGLGCLTCACRRLLLVWVRIRTRGRVGRGLRIGVFVFARQHVHWFDWERRTYCSF